jgi:hypothetical protein
MVRKKIAHNPHHRINTMAAEIKCCNKGKKLKHCITEGTEGKGFYIKSFYGGPGDGFFKKSPLAAGGKKDTVLGDFFVLQGCLSSVRLFS